MKKLVSLVAGAVALAVVAPVLADKEGKQVSPLQFTMKGIDGKPVDLSQYKGKVVLIVNVASQCGLTPQYKGLQALHDKYKDQGFLVLGVPANEFGKQEPGTDAEISEFCTTKYNVTFPMLSKVVVKGKGQVELYKLLTDNDAKPITWNFEKFLIGKDGTVAKRFAPRTAPDAAELTSAIEAELKK